MRELRQALGSAAIPRGPVPAGLTEASENQAQIGQPGRLRKGRLLLLAGALSLVGVGGGAMWPDRQSLHSVKTGAPAPASIPPPAPPPLVQVRAPEAAVLAAPAQPAMRRAPRPPIATFESKGAAARKVPGRKLPRVGSFPRTGAGTRASPALPPTPPPPPSAPAPAPPKKRFVPPLW
jgi:hypothetical protein